MQAQILVVLLNRGVEVRHTLYLMFSSVDF